jgi:uncharacterized membrane protein
MDLQSLEGHRRILGIVFIVMNALTLLVALGFGAFGLAIGQFGMQHARADEEAVVTAVLVGVTGCLFVMGLPGIITGIGLLKRRPWSRMLALVLGCLALPNVPLGTALGIYTIWFYTQAGSDQVFE